MHTPVKAALTPSDNDDQEGANEGPSSGEGVLGSLPAKVSKV